MDFVNFKKQKEKLYFYTERPDIYCVADLNKGIVYDSLLEKQIKESFCCYRSVVPDYDTFCFLMENPEEGLKLLDTNRSIERNLEIIREYRDKKEKEIFIKNLTKINFINQFTKGNYIVVVPQKLDEGKQQLS